MTHNKWDRRECYTFSASSQKWARIEEATPVGLAFSGMAAHGNCVYIAGGRWALWGGVTIETTEQ